MSFPVPLDPAEVDRLEAELRAEFREEMDRTLEGRTDAERAMVVTAVRRLVGMLTAECERLESGGEARDLRTVFGMGRKP